MDSRIITTELKKLALPHSCLPLISFVSYIVARARSVRIDLWIHFFLFNSYQWNSETSLNIVHLKKWRCFMDSRIISIELGKLANPFLCNKIETFITKKMVSKTESCSRIIRYGNGPNLIGLMQSDCAYGYPLSVMFASDDNDNILYYSNTSLFPWGGDNQQWQMTT